MVTNSCDHINSCSDHQLSVAEMQKIHSLFDEVRDLLLQSCGYNILSMWKLSRYS